jgi:putative CocE/NonD family hydrolase
MAEEGADTYTVDFSATTGENTRWHTTITSGDVIYPDRAAEDAKLLTYTSPPLESDVEITGNPVVTLYVSSNETDGAFHIYLEDVAPDGTVTYITEGMLRAIHRNIETDPPYTAVGPYHSLSEADAAPLIPGKVAELQFSLYATSVLIEQGHQIRVSIAGADAGIFQRYPTEGTPTIEVQRNTAYASAIELPIQTK